ncbi:hypothetical protein [Streptomyces mirabilis]|uniref:hypothetical protein n=1 Tax=Streptomyces mirabilis TaxID=68239 RepID=UPI003692C393
MKTFTRKALVVVAIAGTSAFGISGVASAATAGQQVTGTGWSKQEGSAYTTALKGAQNQCPNPAKVSLVSQTTWPAGGDPNNGYWAIITLRCD